MPTTTERQGPPQPLLWQPVGCATPTPAPEPPRITAELWVLASSSSGNCSVLITGEGALRRVTLIDCGLSPARTRVLLDAMKLDFSAIDDVLITHLDYDHFCPSWARKLPGHARIHIHKRHARRAEGSGISPSRMRTYEEGFDLGCGARIQPVLASHDSLGVVAFRVTLGLVSLGYATDLGRVPDRLVEAFRGVDILAIESNYCTDMQRASARPFFLKQRIMDGSGHLSNDQCAEAVAEIKPRRHVVLLHLSRECNTPEKAAAPHAGAAYSVRIANAVDVTGPFGL